MSQNQRQGVLSPPPTASTQPSFQPHSAITHKSHRLRTSPVPGEGSTFVPVVKFSQSFTQRNALRGAKPIYGTTPDDVIQPQEGDIVVPAPRVGGRNGGDGRAHGWTISITSSSPTDDDIQVEVQQHFEPSRPRTPQLQQQQQQQPRIQGLPGGAEVRGAIGEGSMRPRTPILVPPIPTLAHDRLVITEEDISRLRLKSLTILVLGVLFPPLWLLMGWGHALDRFILPAGWAGTVTQQQQILEVYKPFRMAAGVLGGVVVVGTLAGIVIGGLVFGGVIV